MNNSTEKLYESKTVLISYNSEFKFLHVEWKGLCGNIEYVEVLSKQVIFTKLKRASKIIYDLRKLGVISSDNQKYTNEVYFPQVSAAGSKYAAIIQSENVFGKASVNNILGKKDELLFQACMFNDTKQAIDWLNSLS